MQPLEQVRKPYKYEVAADIRKEAFELLNQVYTINTQTDNNDRLSEIDNFIKIFHSVEVRLQACKQMGIVQLKGKRSIYPAMQTLKDIEGQICKWRQYTVNAIKGKNEKKGNANSPLVDVPHNVSMLSQ